MIAIDSESNVNSIFKRRFPRYRSRGICNSLLEAYLTPTWKKITSGYRTIRSGSHYLKFLIVLGS